MTNEFDNKRFHKIEKDTAQRFDEFNHQLEIMEKGAEKIKLTT